MSDTTQTQQAAQDIIKSLAALDAAAGQSTQANRILPQPLPALPIPARVGKGQARLL